MPVTKGTIDATENDIIKNVFAFDDLTVGEICTHRKEVAVLWMDETIAQWEQTIHESRHSVYPVCGDSVDQIVGVLNAKDFFRLKTAPEILSWNTLFIRPISFTRT